MHVKTNAEQKRTWQYQQYQYQYKHAQETYRNKKSKDSDGYWNEDYFCLAGDNLLVVK